MDPLYIVTTNFNFLKRKRAFKYENKAYQYLLDVYRESKEAAKEVLQATKIQHKEARKAFKAFQERMKKDKASKIEYNKLHKEIIRLRIKEGEAINKHHDLTSNCNISEVIAENAMVLQVNGEAKVMHKEIFNVTDNI